MITYEDFLPSVIPRPALALSPDGHQVAYIDDTFGQFNLVVQPLSGGPPQRLTSYQDTTVMRAAWYPDGRALLFQADPKGTEHYQLYRVDRVGGPPKALAHDADPDAQYFLSSGTPFAPDGQRLVYASNERADEDLDILVRDLATGGVRRVYSDGGRVFPDYWSPDGRWITASWVRAGRSDQVIFVIPANGGPARRLTPREESTAYWLGPWLPDGSGFLVMTAAGRDFIELAIMDPATGELSWLDTPGWNVEEVALARDGHTLVWSVNVDGASQLRGRDLRTGRDLSLPALPPCEISGLDLTPDGRTVVMTMSTPTSPTNVVTVDLITGQPHRLTAAAPVGADRAGFVEPELVRYPARDGRQIPAYLYRPKHRSERLGVVMVVHGGPAMQERSSYSNDGFLQYLVALGMAVVAPNIRGSGGYGMAYQRLSHRDWGGGDLRDLADAAAWLQRQPWVDPARIGLVGRSYGGFAVLSCVARLPEVNWAAAAVWCGPSNLVTFTRSQPPGWRLQVAILVGDPDTDAEFLLSRSPVTYAHQIGTPLLVIQGANDPRVPKHESDQIVAQLRSRGVEVRYDVYPDEGHIFGRRENQIKARSAAGEFLRAHLR